MIDEKPLLRVADLAVSYGSSGTLATQIINGAPMDLFLGADYSFPEKLVAAGLAAVGIGHPLVEYQDGAEILQVDDLRQQRIGEKVVNRDAVRITWVP